ncbi:MAG TPA: alcohol dehydrogenase catalytic domain-containing protein [Anaerolineales bacterium]|nr:alcohol dehydrogenase catalytic domain-containing protein [Anaerolineales bacterium]
MAKEMRAIVYLGPEKIELRSLPIPEPRAGELLVKVRAALTCGTDVKTYRRGHPKFPPPFVFGHEFGGDVVTVGSGVTRFREGMRVTANVFAECGECFYCRHGQGNLCENLVYNFGAFAEYMIIPASIVRRTTFEIPAHISYAEAALLEPLVTVVHGWHKVAIQRGETVAILGAGGPISLLHLQLALRSGAGQVIAIGHSPVRLEVASRLGATHVLNAKEVNSLSSIHDLTAGYGADVVIECAGTKLSWETAMNSARRGGRVLWFGGLPTGAKVEVDATRVHYGEIDLLNMHGGTAEDAREAFELIVTRAVKAAPLLSDELPLEQVEQALITMIAGEVVKVIINPEIKRNSVDISVL